MINRKPDYAMAYVYARGYHDGRVKGWCDTEIEWMTPEEVGVYAQGYDKGVADYCDLDENIETGERK